MAKIAFDNFITTKTNYGNVTVRWAHNHKAVKTFLNYDTSLRATRFIRFLVNWYNQPENSALTSELLERINAAKTGIRHDI